jgi:acyl-CoA thioester hydrolase
MTILHPAIFRANLSNYIKELSKSYPSLTVMPIAWGEMDMFGHLNNVWHARYAESARMTYVEQIIKPFMTETQYQNIVKGRDSGIILKSNFIDYKFATTYPDNLILATKFGRLKKDRLSQFTLMISEKHQCVVAKTESVIVTFNHTTNLKEALSKCYCDAYQASIEEYGDQDNF